MGQSAPGGRQCDGQTEESQRARRDHWQLKSPIERKKGRTRLFNTHEQTHGIFTDTMNDYEHGIRGKIRLALFLICLLV